MVSALEAAGIEVFTGNYHMAITGSHLALATGGIEIHTRRSKAAHAAHLLNSLPLPKWRKPRWPLVIFMIFSAFWATVPPPMIGTFLRRVERATA